MDNKKKWFDNWKISRIKPLKFLAKDEVLQLTELMNQKRKLEVLISKTMQKIRELNDEETEKTDKKLELDKTHIREINKMVDKHGKTYIDNPKTAVGKLQKFDASKQKQEYNIHVDFATCD